MSAILLPDSSPLVTLRITFHTGAAIDPTNKPGVSSMTAHMLAAAGSRNLEYNLILKHFFPAAASVSSTVDKEMITFFAEVHRDHLPSFYSIMRDMILDPGWREDDFLRLRDDAINLLAFGLRSDNDEELGKEVLYQEIFANHPYGWHNAGSISALKKMTLDDLRNFYRQNLLPAPVTVGLAGGFPESFAQKVQADFPGGAATLSRFDAPHSPPHNTAVLVQKNTRGVAISFGFPIEVRRGEPDYLPLLVAASALGQHRMSSGRLFTRMRQIRGLNYGDYAYIEHFPGGMFSVEPPPNVARQHQVFQIWIRPVSSETAHFALRLALYELHNLVQNGLTPAEFERTHSFLSKHSNLLLGTKAAELGYAIDSEYYGIGRYPEYVREGLRSVTLDQVNATVRRHLNGQPMRFAIVAQDAQSLRDQILNETSSPMIHNSAKPPEVLDEDRTVESWPVGLQDIRIAPVQEVFA